MCKRTDEDQSSRTAKIEQQKQDQLKDAKGNQGKWTDELASDSESIVRIPPTPPFPHRGERQRWGGWRDRGVRLIRGIAGD